MTTTVMSAIAYERWLCVFLSGILETKSVELDTVLALYPCPATVLIH
jgi:hypothetical protein